MPRFRIQFKVVLLARVMHNGNWRVFFVHPWHNDASLSVTVTGLVVEDIGAKSANKLCLTSVDILPTAAQLH